MIQPEPEVSTQGHSIEIIEVLSLDLLTSPSEIIDMKGCSLDKRWDTKMNHDDGVDRVIYVLWIYNHSYRALEEDSPCGYSYDGLCDGMELQEFYRDEHFWNKQE
ncbi:hypothetical protein Tco_1095142 [Tanacetum coccineum]